MTLLLFTMIIVHAGYSPSTVVAISTSAEGNKQKRKAEEFQRNPRKVVVGSRRSLSFTGVFNKYLELTTFTFLTFLDFASWKSLRISLKFHLDIKNRSIQVPPLNVSLALFKIIFLSINQMRFLNPFPLRKGWASSVNSSI